MNEKITTYSPPVDETNPLPVEADTTGFEDVLEKDGVITTKLNEKVIIQRIAKDLYKNANSGLRELYNNSARACRNAIKKYDSVDSFIKITINEGTRQLIIYDEGDGISKQRFKQVLLELGTSDNLDEGEVGQFGMGFASYTTLSSVVIIDTKARNGDQYKMVAKDGMSFQPVGDSTRETFGTTLTMTCYPEVDLAELVHTLKRLAKYSGVPTQLELLDFEYIPAGFNRGINDIKQVSFDSEVRQNNTKSIDVVDIDTEDFRLIGLASGRYAGDNDSHVHLLNTPIESEVTTPFDWWVLNIKDERKFMPMPDRDRMREKSDNLLQPLITRAIIQHFSDLPYLSYKEFLESDRRNEFLWLTENLDYAPPHLHDILSRLAKCDVRDVVYESKSHNDSGLVKKLSDHIELIYQGYKNKFVSEKLSEYSPAHLITTKKTKKHDWRSDVEFMENWGIPTAKQILKENKIKIPANVKAGFEVIGHTNERYYEHEILDNDSIDENVIRIDSFPINDVLRFVKKFNNPYTFVRNEKQLDDYDSRDFSTWLKNDIPNIVCPTNKGALTIKEIVEGDEAFSFCRDFKPEQEYFLKQEEQIVIYGQDQLLPMLFYLNPECECQSSWNSIPKNSVEYHYFEHYTNERFGVSCGNDEDLSFFVKQHRFTKKCFHPLLLTLLQKSGYGLEKYQRSQKQQKYVKKIREFEAFDETNKVEALVFYSTEYNKLSSDDDDSDFYWALDDLVRDTKNEILKNSYLLGNLMKNYIMPRIFTDVKLKKFAVTDETSNYRKFYDVTIVTTDKEFGLNDEMKVYDVELSFKGIKVKVGKESTEITASVAISG
jgi:hypothetical protein